MIFDGEVVEDEYKYRGVWFWVNKKTPHGYFGRYQILGTAGVTYGRYFSNLKSLKQAVDSHLDGVK